MDNRAIDPVAVFVAIGVIGSLYLWLGHLAWLGLMLTAGFLAVSCDGLAVIANVDHFWAWLAFGALMMFLAQPHGLGRPEVVVLAVVAGLLLYPRLAEQAAR